jgi:amino acid transporter
MSEASDVGKLGTNGLSGPGATDPRSSDQPQRRTLRGKMNVVELMMSVLAFSAPVVVVSSFIPFVIGFAGPAAPIAYIAALIILLFFAVGFTTMGRSIPNPGAFYAYISAGLGKRLGLGSCFLAIFAYLAMSIGVYFYFGSIVSDFLKSDFNITANHPFLYSCIGMAVIAFLGYLRIDLSAKVLSVAMFFEIVMVALFDIAVAMKGGPQGASLQPFSVHSFMGGSVGISVVFAATCFLGFEATAVFREETKDPERTVPKATYLCVVLIGLFYVVATWALVTAYGPDKVKDVVNASYETMFPDAVGTFVGTWARDVVVPLIVTSSFACLLAVQNILARYMYSMGVDKVLPSVLGKVHKRFGSPYISSLAVSVSSFLIMYAWTFTGYDIATSYGLLAGTGGFAVLVLMFLTGLAVLSYFYGNKSFHHISVWNRFIAPIISATCMGAVIYYATISFPTMTGGSAAVSLAFQILMIVIFASGYILAAHYRKRKPEIYTRIGRQVD